MVDLTTYMDDPKIQAVRRLLLEDVITMNDALVSVVSIVMTPEEIVTAIREFDIGRERLADAIFHFTAAAGDFGKEICDTRDLKFFIREVDDAIEILKAAQTCGS